jgi:hypothetical protein
VRWGVFIFKKLLLTLNKGEMKWIIVTKHGRRSIFSSRRGISPKLLVGFIPTAPGTLLSYDLFPLGSSMLLAVSRGARQPASKQISMHRLNTGALGCVYFPELLINFK